MLCPIVLALHYPCSNNHTHSLVLFVYVAGLGQLDVSCAELSSGRELDSVLGAGDHDGVANLGQITADTGELPRGHLHHTAVLLLLEGQMDIGESGTVYMKRKSDTKGQGKGADYLLEYPAAPHPGPSISSHNLRLSPGL